MPPIDFEQLGSFYLGKAYDLAARSRTDRLVLYDARDLVTHAVCVGMTGSGKTGLCLTLLEEAAIDGVPAIIIDPKGDLANLLLTFPELRPQDFRPWINEDDARRKGVDPDTFAAQQAELWKNGLAAWGQDGDRIARLKSAAKFTVYTPGSNAGIPVSVIKSFARPEDEIIDDTELFRERIASTVTSLLGLMNVTADPLQSREHILLSTILDNAWSNGRDLDLPGIIHAIQSPPVTRVGVMELETFYPSRDRFGLAMQLNNLIASPGFSRWLEGEPLDIEAMLHTPHGKPRISIFSIAHLNDAERMFFVSLLLNQTLGWVRTQSGTSSLRAILYMDEIAGYFPPVANPPSKQPLLTLMKQARAFGVGIVLSTQNPVDLDYKGLANAGTWFIGRLQTERDKARVLDGLEGAMATAAAKFDRPAIDEILSQLSMRVFLMNNIHEDGPEIFETRWAMSYLRGPLTRNQIRALTVTTATTPAPSSTEAPPPHIAPHAPSPPATPTIPAASTTSESPPPSIHGVQRPILPPDVPQYFVPVRGDASARLTYRPMLLGAARVYFADAKWGVEMHESLSFLAPINVGPVAVDWDSAEQTQLTEDDVAHQPHPGIGFMPLPADAGKARSYEAWKKTFADTIYRRHTLDLFRSSQFKICSEPGETERHFRARLEQRAREERDAAVDTLRKKYAPKFTTLQDRLRRAQQAVEVQQQQATAAKTNTAISFGAAILGAFMGRKAASVGNVGRATTAARGATRASKEASDVTRAKEIFAAVQQQLADLEAEFQAEAAKLAKRYDAAMDELDQFSIKPKKTNIAVRAVVLVWTPVSSA